MSPGTAKVDDRPMTLPRPTPRVHARPSWRGRIALLALGVAGLWSAGWWGASRLADRGLAQWMADEAAANRAWTCPGQRVTGFPLGLTVHCDQPTFQGETAGHLASGGVEALDAGVTLLHPGTIALRLTGPLTLRATDDNFELVASWGELTVEVPDPIAVAPDRAAEARRLAVTLAVAGQGVFNLRAAHASGQAAPVANAPQDARFALAAEGVTLPTVAIPGLDAPADAAATGVLTGAGLLSAPTVARLEAWRQAGGALQLATVSLTTGRVAGTATGVLSLDAAHRPAGRLDTVLKGFEPMARAFGVPLPDAALGGLLGALLSGGKPRAAGSDGLALPLVLADGRLAVGPFPTGVRLPPLY